ncbi:hypothetical protein GCK32_001471 [Trichostrongylus colubriformis]|uniref:Lipase maturation factor n=1 Tax=Trichostrongylus colubriformis TaxID=6319 RepID=A0AAN8IDL7_TRICO
MLPSFWSGDLLTLKHVLLCSQSLVYLIAFSSLYWQIPGLYGEKGLLPVATKLDSNDYVWQSSFPVLLSLHRYLNLVPSRAFQLLCLIGIVLSFVTACSRRSRNAISYFLLYLLYLNAQRVGGIFLWYQWDTLLLESGFLMAFLAAFSDSALDSIAVFLINWLMCRLMFASGVVKLQSGCPAWWGLTEMEVWYKTRQNHPFSVGHPLRVSMYPHSYCVVFPSYAGMVQKAVYFINILYRDIPSTCLSVAFIIVEEVRVLSTGNLPVIDLFSVLLMVLIMLTGNYNFFNFSIIVISLPMLENGMISYWMSDSSNSSRKLFHGAFAVALAVPLFSVSIVPFTVIDKGIYDKIPEALKNVYYQIDPYQIANSYGLFRTMTGLNGRPEVIVEGAVDHEGPWKEFQFYSKPGNVSEAPVFVLPHQPRLDWQMWFAALGSYRYNPFFLSLVHHLMEATPEVLRLMSKTQPFKETPRFIRAKLYHYRYTPFSEKVDWWTRDLQYEYMPVFPRNDETLVNYLKKTGMLLTKNYRSTGILDGYLSKLHAIVYAMDQARFVWGVLFASIVVIVSNLLLNSFHYFPIARS